MMFARLWLISTPFIVIYLNESAISIDLFPGALHSSKTLIPSYKSRQRAGIALE
jgi:hypothetical protein